ncbi:hypothetical protein B0T18DRAFT_423475 [Schizothecium vesticola]|uniref:Uncharacterized protein n=1 Tax=Schizothecium vesticola TaxID=314040 RepID=A0AA40F804_9PEZI|nr:hypothetical protein B0T18DRAFT_423475 [Schizothecium vesticola]
MDPVSIIGLSAAAVQFSDVGARALLSSLRLLRELREIPHRMADLLTETDKSVERLLYLDSLCQQPSFVSRLSQQQLDSIRPVILDGRNATERLQAVLQPVISDLRKPSKAMRAWAALMSKRREADIEQHLKVITRIHLGRHQKR